MSWVQKIKEGIEITTGDGKLYTPLYVITAKEISYNIAEFEFPEISGTLVKRSKPKGARYNIEIVFQGENHLDESLSFQNSNEDSRAWTISHPMFGVFNAQPVSLSFDPSGLNTSRITGQIIETITDEYPRTSIDVKDNLVASLDVYREDTISSYASSVELDAESVNTIKTQSETIYRKGSTAIKSGNQSNVYFGLFSEAIGNISFGISQVSQMITSVYDLIVYPYLFTDTVRNRLNVLKSQFDSLNNSIPSINSKAEKLNYEVTGGALVAAQILTTLNPLEGDYETSNDVNDIVGELLESYNLYISNLDAFQSNNGSDTSSYIPTFSTVSQLSNSINYATSNLLDISLSAKNERRFILNKDTSPIILAHRFYGLDEEDINLETFISQNKLSLLEMIMIEKGRELVYYV